MLVHLVIIWVKFEGQCHKSSLWSQEESDAEVVIVTSSEDILVTSVCT